MKPILACLAVSVTLAAPAAAVAQTRWEEVQQAFDDYQDAHAAEMVRRSAEAGDPNAQKVYGLMLRFGASLFPAARLAANRSESRKWIDRAVNAEVAAGGIAVLGAASR